MQTSTFTTTKILIILSIALVCTAAQIQKISKTIKNYPTFKPFFTTKTTANKEFFKSSTLTPLPKIRTISKDANAEILRYEADLSPDGSYQYSFETSNGIAAEAVGTPKNFGGSPPVIPVIVKGAFSWVDPEGKTVSIQYVADENGYRPVGDALPTPPPIPAAILRSIEYNRKYGSNN